MTASELSFELRRFGYEIPIEMFTHVWPRRTVKQIHKYAMWRAADHRNAGRPMKEPPMILPFVVRKPPRPFKPGVPTGYSVCWSLKDSGR